MNKFKFSNYKLPHMKSAFPFKKVVEEKLPEFDRTPKRVDVPTPIPIHNNGVVSSSGGNGDSELIKVNGRVVLGTGAKPISQEDFDYYQKQNELYPEYVYDSSSIPGFRDEAELNPDYPNAVIPKSTSIRHAQELMRNPDIRFYSKAIDSLQKLPGYERLKPETRRSRPINK